MSWLPTLPNFQNTSKITLIVLSMHKRPPNIFHNPRQSTPPSYWILSWTTHSSIIFGYKCLCLVAGTSLTRTQAKAQKRSVFIDGGVGLYFITNKLLCLPPPKVVSLQLRRKCHEINRNTENVIIIYCIYKMYFKSLEWTRFHTIICRYCIDISQQSRRV